MLGVQFPAVSVALKALGLESQNTAAADQKNWEKTKRMWSFPLFGPHLFTGDNLEQKRGIALKKDSGIKPGRTQTFPWESTSN